MSRFLVTGASGFVGQALLGYLERHCPSHAAVAVSRRERPGFVAWNGRTAEGVVALLQAHAIDVVVHLAGCTRAADLEAHLDGNLRPASALFDACAAQRVRVVLAGSAGMYGALPASDTAINETQSPRPCNDYGLIKLWQEQLGLTRHRQRGLDVVATRIGNAFGEGQREPFAIPRLLRLIGDAAARGERRFVDTAADTVRDFIHVDDLCRVLVSLAERAPAGEVFNVGSGAGTSMRDVVSAIASVFGIEVEFREPAVGTPPPEIPWQVLDVTRANGFCRPARDDSLAMMTELAVHAAAHWS